MIVFFHKLVKMSNDPNDISESNDYINWLEKSTNDEYLNYYEYSDFKTIQLIGGGNFGKVFRSNYKNSDSIFALKTFDNCKLTLKEIVNEVCQFIKLSSFFFL